MARKELIIISGKNAKPYQDNFIYLCRWLNGIKEARVAVGLTIEEASNILHSDYPACTLDNANKIMDTFSKTIKF